MSCTDSSTSLSDEMSMTSDVVVLAEWGARCEVLVPLIGSVLGTATSGSGGEDDTL
jgi:hypothetical protein